MRANGRQGSNFADKLQPRKLAKSLKNKTPKQAVALLKSEQPQRVARILKQVHPIRKIARVLSAMQRPKRIARILRQMPEKKAARVLDFMKAHRPRRAEIVKRIVKSTYPRFSAKTELLMKNNFADAIQKKAGEKNPKNKRDDMNSAFNTKKAQKGHGQRKGNG